jgi:hypothetical protein
LASHEKSTSPLQFLNHQPIISIRLTTKATRLTFSRWEGPNGEDNKGERLSGRNPIGEVFDGEVEDPSICERRNRPHIIK